MMIIIIAMMMLMIPDQMTEQLHAGRFELDQQRPLLVRIQVVVVSRSGRCCCR
jgi:hypothetical protein